MIPNLCADTSGNNFSFIEMGQSQELFSQIMYSILTLPLWQLFFQEAVAVSKK